MLRHTSFAILLVMAVTLSACAVSPSPSPMIEGDRDAHGCLPSAGYAWCEATQRCERPWELAKQKGFAVSADNFANYCRSGNAP